MSWDLGIRCFWISIPVRPLIHSEGRQSSPYHQSSFPTPQILTHIKTVLNHINLLYSLSLPNMPFFCKKPFATLPQQKQEDNKQLTASENLEAEERQKKDRERRRSAIRHHRKAEARRSFLRQGVLQIRGDSKDPKGQLNLDLANHWDIQSTLQQSPTTTGFFRTYNFKHQFKCF